MPYRLSQAGLASLTKLIYGGEDPVLWIGVLFTITIISCYTHWWTFELKVKVCRISEPLFQQNVTLSNRNQMRDIYQLNVLNFACS